MTIYEGKWMRLVSSGEVYSVRVGTKLGEWIAGQMNRFGLSVRVLSEELGVSYSTVYSMLRGKKEVRMPMIRALCDVFRVPPDVSRLKLHRMQYQPAEPDPVLNLGL